MTETEKDQKGMLSRINEKNRQLREALTEKICGREWICSRLAYVMSREVWLRGSRLPVRHILLTGPAGSGKTYLAESLIKSWDENVNMKVFHMQEYSAAADVGRLFGVPAGYADEGEGEISEFVRQGMKHSLDHILLDHIECASKEVRSVIEHIINYGTYKDAYTLEELSFENVIFIITGNDPCGLSCRNIVKIPEITAEDRCKFAKSILDDFADEFKDAFGRELKFDQGLERLLCLRDPAAQGIGDIALTVRQFCETSVIELSGMYPGTYKDDMPFKIRVRNWNLTENDYAYDMEYNIQNYDQRYEAYGRREDRVKEKRYRAQYSDYIRTMEYVMGNYFDPERCLGMIEAFQRTGMHLEFLFEKAEFNGEPQVRILYEDIETEDFLDRDIENEYDERNCRIIYAVPFAVKDADKEEALLAGQTDPVFFDDMIGNDNVKAELKEIQMRLDDYRFSFMEDKTGIGEAEKAMTLPKGLLFYGAPGTGKTMFAKALATESQLPFFSMNGSSFINKYAGSGPQAVRDLFEKARKHAPSIIFIDEFDAIARQRTGSEGREAVEDTLNMLLSEMDGVKNNSDRPVIVVAATNYAIKGRGQMVLDPAIVRRFDHCLYFKGPDADEREQFLKNEINGLLADAAAIKRYAIKYGYSKGRRKRVYNDFMKIRELGSYEQLSTVNFEKDHLKNLVKQSDGLSLADLKKVISMALQSMKENDGELYLRYIQNAIDDVRHGETAKSKKDYTDVNEKKRLERCAYHEAGHALLYLLNGVTPAHISIQSNGIYNGYVQFDQTEGTLTRKNLMVEIRAALAGRAAEIVKYGAEEGLSVSAEKDLRAAEAGMRDLYITYGMDEDGLHYIPEDAVFPETLRLKIEQALQTEMEYVISLMKENSGKLDILANRLLLTKRMSTEEIENLLRAK